MLVARLALRRRAGQAAVAAEPALVGGRDRRRAPRRRIHRSGSRRTAARRSRPTADGAERPSDHDPGRRLLLARGAAIFAGLTAVGVTGYGVRTALGAAAVERVQIPLAKLPRGHGRSAHRAGLRHPPRPAAGRGHTERIVEMINRLDADIVAIVGDLVDGTVAELGAGGRAARELRARHGAFFVTGNHEYYSGVRGVDRGGPPARAAPAAQRARGDRHRAVLDLAGVNDVDGARTFGDGPDFAKALGGRDPANPVVLLAHQPVAGRRGGPARRGPAAVRPHPRRADGALQPVVAAAAAGGRPGSATVDGTQVYVTQRRGFLGPAGPGRGAAGGHARRAAHAVGMPKRNVLRYGPEVVLRVRTGERALRIGERVSPRTGR